MMSSVSEIFQCQRCGYCCHGDTTVSLDEKDQQRIIDALGLTEEEVKKKFWRITGTTVQMKVTDGHCIFYEDGCIVHKGRPWRCGQWPLHPSILIDENNFLSIAESCPGLNKEIGYKKFCEILREIMKDSIVKC